MKKIKTPAVCQEAAEEWKKFAKLFREIVESLDLVTTPTEVTKRIFKEHNFERIGKKTSHQQVSSWPYMAKQLLGELILSSPKLQVKERQRFYLKMALESKPLSTVRVIDGARGWKKNKVTVPERKVNAYIKPISIETKTSASAVPVPRQEADFETPPKKVLTIRPFVEKHLVVDPASRVPVSQVYQEYRRYCAKRLLRPAQISVFLVSVAQMGYTASGKKLEEKQLWASLVNLIDEEEKKPLPFDPTLEKLRIAALTEFHHSVRAELNLGKIREGMNLSSLFKQACLKVGLQLSRRTTAKDYVDNVRSWMVRLLPEAIHPLYHCIVLETEKAVYVKDEAIRKERGVPLIPVSYDKNGQLLLPLEDTTAPKKARRRRSMNKKVASKTFKNRGSKTIPQRNQPKLF